MPRDLPVGNGNLLVTFDAHYGLRDVYWPFVGKENHTRGHVSRFGVYVDHQLSWTDSDDWERDLRYEPETLVTRVELLNRRLGLRLDCQDAVDFDRNVLLRRVNVTDLRDGGEREVKLFWHQNFQIWGSSEGDTAYYDPDHRAVVHYKGKCWMLANAWAGAAPGVHAHAVGAARHGGAEGTWRDAEDGVLVGHGIAQGSVDSTVMAIVSVGGETRRATAYYWLCVADSLHGVQVLDEIVVERTPARMIGRNVSYWRSWVNKDDIPFGDLPDDLVRFYKQSLLILRTQIDNRGAIIAANDGDSVEFNRDTYSYLWPRDGALVAHALDLAGQPEVARPFYSFCADVMEPAGYLLHKYHPDGSVGSSWHPWVGIDGRPQLPIQEDETALVVWALFEHYQRFRDLEFVRPLYAPLVRRAGDFMVAFRDELTRLPAASWDLWEERRGIHAFTVASVYGGLRGAAGFARIFGDDPRADAYEEAARQIKEAAAAHLYDEKLGRFVRRINTEGGLVSADPILDASLFGLFRFGLFDADDARVVRTMRAVEERLWVKTHVGGVARYEDDYYYQVTHDVQAVPGNPWFICTLWLAEWYLARAQTMTDLARPLEILQWVADAALPSGVLAEQLHPYHHSPLSVSPLTWSHATVVMVVKEYLGKLEEIARLETKNALLSGRYEDDAVYD